MRVLLWHVHGSWTTSFVEGAHTYLLPVVPGRGPDGRGRARTWDWPTSAQELTPAQLRHAEVDVVILQRPEDERLAAEWLGRRPGRDVPALWLEHNAPQGRINDLRHPAADRDDLRIVHVTHTNQLFWDTGRTPTVVIEHGVADTGHRYTGELARAAVVVNEPVRRGRVVGADLLGRFSEAVALDVFGMGVTTLAPRLPGGRLAVHEDLAQERLHSEMARRRVYLHPVRWTSLGLSLVEAMLLGMPVVALATTEVPQVVPPGAGVVSNRIEALTDALGWFGRDLDAARAAGDAARRAALDRFGLKRFLADWDRVLEEAVKG